MPRRLVWAAMRRDRSTMATYLEDAKLGVPVPVAVEVGAPVVHAAARANHATDENVRQDLANLPGLLDHVDGLLRAGTIGGAQPNAADFQIATSTALLATLEDVAPRARRAAGARARPPHRAGLPGPMPKVFPAAWLQA